MYYYYYHYCLANAESRGWVDVRAGSVLLLAQLFTNRRLVLIHAAESNLLDTDVTLSTHEDKWRLARLVGMLCGLEGRRRTGFGRLCTDFGGLNVSSSLFKALILIDDLTKAPISKATGGSVGEGTGGSLRN